MRNQQPFHPRLNLKSILLLTCLFSAPSWANYDPTVSDFALFIQHTDMDWAYPAVIRQTTSTRLLAVWHENFNPSLKGGLRLAYLDLSQASNPLPSAQNSTGYSLGFDIHALLLDRRLLHLGLAFAYDYQSTHGNSPDQTSDFVWHTGIVGIDMIIAPAAQLSLLAGARLTYLDGEQRVSGNLNQIIPFNEDEPIGYYAGLNLKTDATGSIGLKWHGGTMQGLELVFRREF
jgi:hypothetical protein